MPYVTTNALRQLGFIVDEAFKGSSRLFADIGNSGSLLSQARAFAWMSNLIINIV